MRPRLFRNKVESLWRRAASQDGMAAVEFAMLLPFMITLFFGVVESTLALLCRADVSIMASTAADLISQADTLASADVSNVYSAAGAILYPYYDPSKTGSAKPTIRITSVIYDTTAQSTTVGKVAWVCTQSGSGALTPSSRTVGSTVTLPQALLTSGGSVIMAEIAYSYASPTTKVITGSINFTTNFYTKPRRVPQIASPTGGCP
ncbi:MAG TPA: TadE/TadG family type IV pilus assembly protein [Rhizomicrobium sp.]|jgi:Flp pilus assembly protein TadG|nr:TadE/TadG family type IV pilus assembly protein [Rhizomicrobium sp.]